MVLEPDRDSDDPRPLVLTEHRWAGRISSADYSGASAPLGSMSLPKRVEHRQPRVRRDLASALRSAAAGLVFRRPKGKRGGGSDRRDIDPELAVAARTVAPPSGARTARPGGQGPHRRALSAGGTRQRPDPPEGRCGHQLAGAHVRPDRRAAHRTRLHRRSTRRTIRRRPTTAGCWPGSTAKVICWWPNACAPELEGPGRPPNLAAALSAVVYESRGGDGPSPRRGSTADGGTAARPGDHPAAVGQLRADENRHRIAPTREPDEGFVTAAYRWATTGDLADARWRPRSALGQRDAVVGRRFRAVVPPDSRPARPGADRLA